jgi:hypothetical protein
LPATKPFIALVLNFTARFFDFDLLGLRGDLRSSYLWLVAAIAPIGILMPWFMAFEWCARGRWSSRVQTRIADASSGRHRGNLAAAIDVAVDEQPGG